MVARLAEVRFREGDHKGRPYYSSFQYPRSTKKIGAANATAV